MKKSRTWWVVWKPAIQNTVDQLKVIDAWDSACSQEEAEDVMKANRARYQQEHGPGYVQLIESKPNLIWPLV